MKYLLLKIDKERYWFEIGGDSCANRQIILDEYGRFHVSCLEDCLSEGPIDVTELEGDRVYLTKKEFENIWQTILKPYKEQWEEIKKKYFIGAYVQGLNKYIYPQGTVIKGEDFLAIYKGEGPFYINKLVQYKIDSYDDKNMWLVVA